MVTCLTTNLTTSLTLISTFSLTNDLTIRRTQNCERETEILGEQQPPKGVFICYHAGRVIDKVSLKNLFSEQPCVVPHGPTSGFCRFLRCNLRILVYLAMHDSG